MNDQLSQFAVYTIRSARLLRELCEKGGSGQFKERRRWVAAHNLLKQAEKAGARFPIIFADAGDDFDGLIYYGFIKKLNLDGNCTTYSFDGLSHIDPELPKNTLKLRSTGAHLSNAYIRPYAIVHIPGFIHAG